MKTPGQTHLKAHFCRIEVKKHHPDRRIKSEQLRTESGECVTGVEVTTTAVYDPDRSAFRFQTVIFSSIVEYGRRHRLSDIIEMVETPDEDIAKQNHLKLCRKYSRDKVGGEELWSHRYDIVEWTSLGPGVGYKEFPLHQCVSSHATVCITDYLDRQKEAAQYNPPS